MAKHPVEGLWITDQSIEDQQGTTNFEKERFPGIIDFFKEVRSACDVTTVIAGPFWGLGLLLWARGLASHFAIGLGSTYRYYLPGGMANPPKARVMIAPLRRWTKAQLDHIWMVRGADQTKRWALKATLMIATHDGQTLLDFLSAVRGANFVQSEGQEVAACLLAEQQGLSRVAEKLRAQRQVAGFLQVFLETNPHAGGPQYHPSAGCELPTPSSDSSHLAEIATGLLRRIHRPGFSFRKIGVLVTNLVPDDATQLSFDTPPPHLIARRRALMATMDKINREHGRATVRIASAGPSAPAWKMRQGHLSPCYTTRWDALLTVSA